MSGPSSRTNRRVSTACGRCKKAKCKCTGPPAPCDACSGKGRECAFEEALDGRRKETTGLALEAARAKHQAYKYLLGSLRSPNKGLVNALVEAIREGSKLPELGILAEEYRVEGDRGVVDQGEAEDESGDEDEDENRDEELEELEEPEGVVAGPNCLRGQRKNDAQRKASSNTLVKASSTPYRRVHEPEGTLINQKRF